MDIYKNLNECIEYIEKNLDKDIDYVHIARIFGSSLDTVSKVFSLIAGKTLKEYIRNRRLTVAVKDIREGQKIIDVAFKYGYKTEESFARSFKRLHGVIPRKVKSDNVKCFAQPILYFEVKNNDDNVECNIVSNKGFTLYGIKEKVNGDVPSVAEPLWHSFRNKYGNIEGKYGVTKTRPEMYYYTCVDYKDDGLELVEIPKSDWLVFKCNSIVGKDISKLFMQAYRRYIPSMGLKEKAEFEVEVYKEDEVELYVQIN